MRKDTRRPCLPPTGRSRVAGYDIKMPYHKYRMFPEQTQRPLGRAGSSCGCIDPYCLIEYGIASKILVSCRSTVRWRSAMSNSIRTCKITPVFSLIQNCAMKAYGEAFFKQILHRTILTSQHLSDLFRGSCTSHQISLNVEYVTNSKIQYSYVMHTFMKVS
jgi:hypothetical protein